MSQSDHDEIIEDYEVESSSPPQAQGGPPGPQPARPTPAELGAAAAGRGKITHGQAKLIWAICIAVCLLGAGAVGVHYFFLSDRGEGGGGGNRPVSKGGQPKGQPPRELTEREKAVNAYIKAVGGNTRALKSTKAWDFFLCRKLKFDAAMRAAQAVKASEDADAKDKAWLEVIKTHLDAQYAADLFRHVNHPVKFVVPEDMYLPPGNELAKGLESFSDEWLKNEELQRMHAADLVMADHVDALKQFQIGPRKYDLTCSKIWQDQKDRFREEFQRSEKAREIPPVFEPADLEFARGKDYAPNEPMMSERVWEEIKAKEAGAKSPAEQPGEEPAEKPGENGGQKEEKKDGKQE